MNRLRTSLLLVGAISLCACASAQKDWSEAASSNTVASYQDYLNKHPTGEHSSESRNKIRTLQDDAA